MKSPRRLDLAGQKFNRLTVIAEARLRRQPSGQVVRYWECRCKCGAAVEATTGSLRSGATKSCGCLRRDQIIERSTKHGHAPKVSARTPEYNAWKAMRSRCGNPRNQDYKRYGGRGIRVCARWDDFEIFLQDMGPRPTNKHSLDRIDSNGNYEPGNCRWATRKQQSRNREYTHRLNINGRTIFLPDLAREIDIKPATLRARLRSGWDHERVASTQLRGRD